MGVESGAILAASIAKDSAVLQPLAHTGGWPAGVALHPDGYLAVCDATQVGR